MENREKLDELTEAILRFIKNKSAKEEKIVASFSSENCTEDMVITHIKILENKDYIKKEDRVVGAFGGSNGNVLKEVSVYRVTPLGENYFANATVNFASFSNITNSNVAHLSSNVTQAINISDQPRDIQEKIKELKEAIAKKDSSGIKKAFGYIADKAVDVAIAILTGVVLR